MKQFIELERDLKSNEEFRELAMDIAQTIFTKSQENLIEPMPWGDKNNPQKRHPKPTKITDQSLILLSGVPPYWESGTVLAIRYDAIHSSWVEYGTPPHAVSEKGVQSIQQWVKRKLGKRGEKESRRFADRIAWKIRKYGMDPHPFVRPAVDATAQQFKMVKITME